MDLSSPDLTATRGRLLTRFGSRVESWWERLPDALAELAARWELAMGDAVGRGNTSLVLRCRRADGRDAILKLTPDEDIARTEAHALRSWQSSGRVPLLWGCDASMGALLLEAIPGELPVSQARAQVAVAEIAELISALHRAGASRVTEGVTPLAGRVDFLFELWIARCATSARIPRALAAHLHAGRERARALARESATEVLLHGDLHPSNVLDGGAARGLVAIDPRPCVGDAAFDAIDWVFWGAHGRPAWQERNQALAAALDVDADRLWEWCRALAALLAAGRAVRGEAGDAIDALLDLAP